jgi:hypothetical protein
MSELSGAERRQAERVDAQLNLQVHLPLEDGPTSLQMLNVSSAGVYFRSKRYIEPMTKLEMEFDVPVGDVQLPVRCEGIIARIIPELPDPSVEEFDVAVFFTTIDSESFENLEAYIAGRLEP